jgi:hypothetical protein
LFCDFLRFFFRIAPSNIFAVLPFHDPFFSDMLDGVPTFFFLGPVPPFPSGLVHIRLDFLDK